VRATNSIELGTPYICGTLGTKLRAGFTPLSILKYLKPFSSIN
jgi:hypothetical protein